MRFTDMTVRKLPVPEKGQRLYYDDAFPSFGCRVSQGGARSFFVQCGADRRFITIGRYPIISLAQAREQAHYILAERTLGKHRPKSIAWDEALSLFLAASAQKNRPRTVKDYRRLLERHFPFARTQLSGLAPQDIARRLDRLAATGAEQNHALAAVKTFFRWAQRRNYIERSPCDGMQTAKRLARERVLTDAELVAVYRNALDTADVFSSIVALLILTGQRRSEIGSIRWEWIDSNDRTITFPSSVTKNKRAHTIPFGATAAMIFERMPRCNEYVFPAARDHVRGKPTTSFCGWSKGKHAFDRACPIVPWTLHDLRRTFATNLAGMSVPVHVVEKLLNHASGTISGVAAIYNKFQYMDEMRAAIEAWERRLASLLEC